MKTYAQSKLSTVERERLDLLKNCNLIQVEFIPFNSQSSDPIKNSPLHFKRASARYFANQSLKRIGGLARSPCEPSLVVREG